MAEVLSTTVADGHVVDQIMALNEDTFASLVNGSTGDPALG